MELKQGNEVLLFQIVDLFPMPIEIFAPDGTTVFANRAALEMWNISGSDQIVGSIAYIVNIFITTRMYQGRTDIARAREYIEVNWLEEFDMDKMAQWVNLSKYHFARLFKKHTAMTPYSYYQNIKIKKLKESLCDKNLSITQAFAVCGVDYNGNYAKLFKEKTGMTPSQYRETVWQK